MPSLLRFGIFSGTLLFSSVAVHAQPASATFRPALLESYSVEYSYSGASDLKRGATLGEVDVHHTDVSVSGRLPVNQTTMFLYGAALSVNQLQADSGLPLPDRLGELSANLGLSHRFSPALSLSGFVRPGFYSDLENFSSDAFNAPVLLLGRYATSQDLVWSAGVSANFFSDRGVMPVAGVRWKFAPEWTFNLGFPRAGFTWDVKEKLSLNAGLSIQGGSYRVTESLGVPAPGIARLANTYVDYREIRFGAGADFKLSEHVSVSVEAGVMTDRRFEFYDRDYTLNGEAAPYGSVGLSGRF
jgi:hypothetical protein